MTFRNIPMEDKLYPCYLHACLMYIQGEALKKNLIKVFDPNTAPRYMKYIPIWAKFNLPVTCW